MRRIIFVSFLAALIAFQPALIFAQGVAGYGQAVGQRRQQNRTLTPQTEGGSFEDATLPSLTSRGGTAPSMQPGTSTGGWIEGGYQVHILGQVGSPGTYRLPASIRMAEAIARIGGGISEQGSNRRVELRRNQQVTTYDLFLFRNRGDLSQNPFLLDNDVIYVPFSKKNVAVQGPVKKPGTYELSSRERNGWDVIQLAGGYTAGASFDQSITIIRYEGQQKKLLAIANSEEALRSCPLLNGDIIIVPHVLTGDRRFDYNVGKLPADNVFYPTFNDNVFVVGAVGLPGAFTFSPNYSLRDYVNMAGPNRVAKIKRIRVLNPEGKIIANTMKDGFHVSPGDTIVVPEKSLTVDNVIKWYNTVANSVITGFTLRELLRR